MFDLKNKTAVRYVMVMRAGKVKTINADDIVVGDIVFLQSGETVPADGYILDGAINVNNSVLNGESEECPKSPIVGYKYNRNAKITSDDYVGKNLLFAGTTVQSGECQMYVTRVGVNTENARTLIKSMSNDEVSDLIETDDAFYIVKMINNDDPEAYDNEVKNKISSEENSQFSTYYNDTLKKQYKFKVQAYWKDIVNIGSVTTA